MLDPLNTKLKARRLISTPGGRHAPTGEGRWLAARRRSETGPPTDASLRGQTRPELPLYATLGIHLRIRPTPPQPARCRAAGTRAASGSRSSPPRAAREGDCRCRIEERY